jgi:hypothetical protein
MPRRHRLSVRTSPFQGGKTGSIPVGATTESPLSRAFFTVFCRPSTKMSTYRRSLTGDVHVRLTGLHVKLVRTQHAGAFEE